MSCAKLVVMDQHERGKIPCALCGEKLRLCAYGICSFNPTNSCLSVFITEAHMVDVMTACCAIPVLYNIWRRTSCLPRVHKNFEHSQYSNKFASSSESHSIYYHADVKESSRETA